MLPTLSLRPRRVDGGRARAAELAPFFVLERAAPRHQVLLLLPHDGVLSQWLVPRGMWLRPGERHLAIPLGAVRRDAHLGASGRPVTDAEGQVWHVWDRGDCEIREWSRRRLIVVLHGAQVRGAFALVPLRRDATREWLIFSLRRKPRPTARALAPPRAYLPFVKLR